MSRNERVFVQFDPLNGVRRRLHFRRGRPCNVHFLSDWHLLRHHREQRCACPVRHSVYLQLCRETPAYLLDRHFHEQWRRVLLGLPHRPLLQGWHCAGQMCSWLPMRNNRLDNNPCASWHGVSNWLLLPERH